MKRAALWTTALIIMGASPGSAQPGPKGPGDIIGGAQRQRATREMRQAADRAQPGAATPTPEPVDPHANPHAANADASGAAPNPHGGMAAHGGSTGEGGEPPPISRQSEDPRLATGSIRARVVDQAGNPVASAQVDLGIMGADSLRSSRTTRTAADGTAMFDKLKVGEGQAYRVNVPYQGAKYSSSPFRLPVSGGYQVDIRRLPVTRSEKMVVLYVGATSIELKDDRLKFVQQVRLFNLGGDTYVFPTGGTLVRLPKGFLAMQTEDVMGDQHVVEQKGEGVRVSGSLPPGEATLLWGFDLPLAGTEMKVALDLPWTTFAYRVIVDAPEGLSLSVDGMPEPMLHADEGRRFLVTELQRKVGDDPFRQVKITLLGIPGPGPERFIASFLAVLLVVGGIALAWRTKPTSAARRTRDVEAQKAELLARARVLQAQHQAGEIGPQYHADEIGLLVDALASLLLEDARRQKPAAARS